MTTNGDLLACLNRLVQGRFAFDESPVYLLSRDGEQLRPIGHIGYRPNRRLILLERSLDEGETLTLSQLALGCRMAPEDAEVKLIADGRSTANAEPLDAVKLAAEITELNGIDLTEPQIVLCT